MECFAYHWGDCNMKQNMKAEFKFSAYFVAMFLIIALMGIFSAITANMMVNYDQVNMSSSFQSYLNNFEADKYADEDVLGVSASDAEGDFGEYEASFDFVEQVKTTKNSTDLFITATSDELGLSSAVWWIIGSILGILLLVAGVFFLRGTKE